MFIKRTGHLGNSNFLTFYILGLHIIMYHHIVSDQSKSRLILVSLRLPFVVTRKDDGTIGRTESRDEMYRTMSHVVLQSKGSKWIGNPGTSYQKVASNVYFSKVFSL